MAKLTMGRENSDIIEIDYEDHGIGRSVVLVHAHPLNGAWWEKQQRVLLEAGWTHLEIVNPALLDCLANDGDTSAR
ncbi:hypothetical protein ACFXG4_41560 [Nocardia sp. NPDC059246]|uniref:hypothetical protein n=1 Tax=unclassified Nocardia TaxID=2637762 RepID=UPI003691DC43